MHAAAEGTEGQGGPVFWEEAGSRARPHVYKCLLLVLSPGLSAGLTLSPFLNLAPVTESAFACTSFANSLPYRKSALLASPQASKQSWPGLCLVFISKWDTWNITQDTEDG